MAGNSRSRPHKPSHLIIAGGGVVPLLLGMGAGVVELAQRPSSVEGTSQAKKVDARTAHIGEFRDGLLDVVATRDPDGKMSIGVGSSNQASDPAILPEGVEEFRLYQLRGGRWNLHAISELKTSMWRGNALEAPWECDPGVFKVELIVNGRLDEAFEFGGGEVARHLGCELELVTAKGFKGAGLDYGV